MSKEERGALVEALVDEIANRVADETERRVAALLSKRAKMDQDGLAPVPFAIALAGLNLSLLGIVFALSTVALPLWGIYFVRVLGILCGVVLFVIGAIMLALIFPRWAKVLVRLGLVRIVSR